jgi:subtilase family serine protease
MRSRLSRRIFSALVLFGGMVPALHAAVQNRIVGGAGSKAVELPQSVVPRVSKSTDLGEANGTTPLNSISLYFNMTGQQKAALTQLLIDQQNPSSPKYHQWLTPEQFAAQFGLSSADIATVSQWLAGQGFKVTSIARSHTFIQFSGTVAQAQSAFQTSIHRLSLNGEEHLANTTAVSLPSGIGAVVASVRGLDDFKLKPRAHVRTVQANANPKYTSSISGDTYIAPGDFYTIYDVEPLLTGSINGTGISIAVAGQTDISLSDVTAFRSASGLSTTNLPTVKLFGTDPGTSANDIDEAQLDVEWSGAVAPSASIIYANSTDVITSLTDIIDNKLAPIASISYGDCESGTGASNLNALNTLFMQANAEGITVLGPAGDSGATDCDYQSASATQGLAVDFPASSPYVTGLGGTEFNEGTGTYFGTTNNSNGGSALSYIPEMVWNDTTADLAAGGTLSAGGGGLSSFFTKPYWQTGNGVPNDFARDVPDVSLNASADHDGYLFCSQGFCVNGFRDSATPTATCTTGNCLDVVGGTSVSTPAFAGILALVEQKIGATTGIGNANPTIYALANSTTYYPTVFHDVTVGNNDSPCTAGSTDCPTGGSIGYSATTGYDLATGWGSVDAFVLANSWALVTPAGAGTTGTAISTTNLSASATSVTSGTSVTFTATVANGGTAAGATPTGTVQFLVDNVPSGSGVMLSSGTATFTLATTSLSSGNHIISAAYSGDSTYAGSKASVNVDVTSATVADFTLTPATATATAAAGATAAGIVFTVTPVNGFVGSVAFSATTTSSTLNATYSFSVTPVVISSSTPGTTTLTLSAYVTGAAAAPGTYTIIVTGTGTDGSVTATHSSTVTFVVTAPPASAANITLTPTTATVTTKSGTDAPGLVFTVVPVNGFTGSVAFSASAISTLNATYAFSVTPVLINSTASGTTTLTLSAYASNGAAALGKGRLKIRPVGAAAVEPPIGSRRGWAVGSGAALACMVLFMLPRRRKFGALLGALVGVAALGGMLGMSGCGGGTSTVSTTTDSTPGTYTVTVTALGTTTAGVPLAAQTATVTFVVQ